MIAFTNVIPMDEALALIDENAHPHIHEVARQCVNWQATFQRRASPDRLEAWIAGYKRFGDQFEEVFAETQHEVYQPSDVTAILEEALFDAWMTVGLLETELPLSVQRIHTAVANPYSRVAPDVATLVLKKAAWPHEFDGLVDWLFESGDLDQHLAPMPSDTWRPWLRPFRNSNMVREWTPEEAAFIAQHIPYSEVGRLLETEALHDPENMVLHYVHSVPLELLPR